MTKNLKEGRKINFLPFELAFQTSTQLISHTIALLSSGPKFAHLQVLAIGLHIYVTLFQVRLWHSVFMAHSLALVFLKVVSLGNQNFLPRNCCAALANENTQMSI